MASRNRVYVARKECGCIVAAFPVYLDKACKGEILKQLAKAGLDVEQTVDFDVRINFDLTCNHNRPPLLDLIDQVQPDADGVDQTDVDAAGTDLEPAAEEAEAQINAEEERAEMAQEAADEAAREPDYYEPDASE